MTAAQAQADHEANQVAHCVHFAMNGIDYSRLAVSRDQFIANTIQTCAPQNVTGRTVLMDDQAELIAKGQAFIELQKAGQM